jgi:hypothetical protein
VNRSDAATAKLLNVATFVHFVFLTWYVEHTARDGCLCRTAGKIAATDPFLCAQSSVRVLGRPSNWRRTSFRLPRHNAVSCMLACLRSRCLQYVTLRCLRMVACAMAGKCAHMSLKFFRRLDGSEV